MSRSLAPLILLLATAGCPGQRRPPPWAQPSPTPVATPSPAGGTSPSGEPESDPAPVSREEAVAHASLACDASAELPEDRASWEKALAALQAAEDLCNAEKDRLEVAGAEDDALDAVYEQLMTLEDLRFELVEREPR